MRGDVTDAGHPNKQLKIELLSQWKLEAESRKNKKRKHFAIQNTPQNLGKLTSETTFENGFSAIATYKTYDNFLGRLCPI